MTMLLLLLAWLPLGRVWSQSSLGVQEPPPAASALPAAAPSDAPPAAPPRPTVQQTADELERLVAPIALYPDALLAQVLAAATFPDQVVQADRWLQAHPELTGAALGQALDQQTWDPSVKAIAAFPSVLGNMDKNLAWTSALGDAYYNQQAAIMDAVQVMRQRAQAAGNLSTTPQQTVATTDSWITIQPASVELIYVPAYDPWLIYGTPIPAWPGWYPYPGIWSDGPSLAFGVGFGLGYLGAYSWGWRRWDFDWHHHYPSYGGARYYSGSVTFSNRNNYYRGGGERGVHANLTHGMSAGRAPAYGNASVVNANGRSAARALPSLEQSRPARGYAEPQGASGVRSGLFSGYDRGGATRGFSSRGGASLGGGRGGVGGGGGGHGGGGGRGGRAW